MHRRLPRALGALLIALTLTAWPTHTVTAGVPVGFTDTPVTAVESPTGMAFLPDGTMLITSQGGTLRVFANGELLAAPAIDIGDRICDNSERGLLGVAVDPAFAQNRAIYLYYTFKKHGVCPTSQPTNSQNPVNRVGRFTLAANNTVDPASEVILVDNIISPNGNHNGGDLQFGKDGHLYISVGDGGCDYAGDSGCAGSNDAARDRHVLLGKVLRITRDGGIPAANPFLGANTARCYDPAPGGNKTGSIAAGQTCQETFVWGLRNPFRLAFDHDAAETRFFINDVGQNAYEEIDLAQAGADYGYPCREGRRVNSTSGKCNPAPPNMVGPVHEYFHENNCNSITGGAFVPRGLWPAAFDGAYLYSDYVCGKIFSFVPNGGQFVDARALFADNLGTPVNLRFGPSGATQALYYTTYAGGGQVRRVAYTAGTNRAPTAQAAATPTFGVAPLKVTFSGAGSSDPDGDALTYSWQFGDGAQATGITTTHTYTRTGIFTATLTVRDARGATSAPASVRVDAGNTPPTARIVSPMTATRFAVGDTITLRATASDAEDMSPPLVSWQVWLRHVTPDTDHTHPLAQETAPLPPASAVFTFTAPLPEDLLAAEQSLVEIELRAVDSTGLTTVVTQALQPQRVAVTLASEPAGRKLIVNGEAFTTPRTLTSWAANPLAISAPGQLVASPCDWERLQSWNDGPATAGTRTIVTPAITTTYTAFFAPVPRSEVSCELAPIIGRAGP